MQGWPLVNVKDIKTGVKLYIIWLVGIDGTKVFKLLCGYFGSKVNYLKQKQVAFEKAFVICSEKAMMPFFDLQFSEVLRIVQEN